MDSRQIGLPSAVAAAAVLGVSGLLLGTIGALSVSDGEAAEGSPPLANAPGPEPQPPPPRKPTSPLSPREELATFRVPAGFHVELVACEPAVVDPVALAFDEDGRLYVAEMRGYPNAGVATGNVHTGRVKRLEDVDADGLFGHSTIYADHLRFPTSVMPYRDGVLAAVAPDILFLADTEGTGRANVRRTLYTGFDLANIQQLVNSLQWGLDNWVHACAGMAGGTVRSTERPANPAVPLHGRGVRFRPDVPGSLEPTSGGGQFGLAADDGEHWFTATNSQHLRHIVLPDNYLRRNSAPAVSAVTEDVPDHGTACQVFRLSPFEHWRVERTSRRRGGPDADRFPSTELVPGGFITSACSPVVYTADRFPAAYRGNTFVCDPANNVIHRDVLEPHGATFIARRAEPDREFFASTDNWCRPVNLTVGPDGALYFADFYREVIETPLSLPEDIKRRLNLESRGRGRIWRIVPDGKRAYRKPALRRAPAADLVRHLADPNAWWRLTAQRLLVERRDSSVVPPLQVMAHRHPAPVARVHALWTLEGLSALDVPTVLNALGDRDAGVREQALRLAETRLARSPRLQAAVVRLSADRSPRVRFQLALALGEVDGPAAFAALLAIARIDNADPWTQSAVLSSAGRRAAPLLEALLDDKAFAAAPGAPGAQLVSRLAELLGATAPADRWAGVLARVAAASGARAPGARSVLLGLGRGAEAAGRPVQGIWDSPPTAIEGELHRLRRVFEQAAAEARDEGAAVASRSEAIRLLAFGPLRVVRPALTGLLDPRTPPEVQMAAVRALGVQQPADVADDLLAAWPNLSPAVRREVLEALFARPQRLPRLLDALEHKTVHPSQIEPFRRAQLARHPDPKLRRRARAVLEAVDTPDRRKVLGEYRAALLLPADPSRGRAVFRKVCTTCHRLEGVGVQVGPDLLSALPTKTTDVLLADILDPSREVDPRYVNYVATTRDGRSFSGMIAAETANSITLRRAERVEDTIRRSDVEEIQATAQSLMPDGLESQLSKQDFADVIAYLRSVVRQPSAAGSANPSR